MNMHRRIFEDFKCILLHSRPLRLHRNKGRSVQSNQTEYQIALKVKFNILSEVQSEVYRRILNANL